jgi:predicted Fe-Mo cluster-binding NifX family protein
MRIAVSADNKNGLDSIVSPHFGRCPHFILVDLDGTEAAEVREVDNPFYGNHQPGQVPGFVASLEANVMLTGGMGGRAIMFFQQYQIEGVTGAYGTVRQSLERCLGGCQTQGIAPVGELPFDTVVTEAMVQGRPVSAYQPDGPLARALREV